jgi:isopentenyl phosphate kinase
VIAEAGQIVSWPVEPIQSALRVGLLPILFGDVVFDRQWGGTIQSTEELFIYLAHQLSPRRILLAGLEEGVWADFPHKKHLIPCIHPGNFDELQSRIMGSSATDVTGGMLAKVTSMLALVQQIPNLEVLIFSGLKPGCLSRALRGENPGTLICNTQGDKR